MGFTFFIYLACYPLSDIFFPENFPHDRLKDFFLEIAGFSYYGNELTKNDCSMKIPFELVELEV